jgi:hypothetical protein
LAVRAAPDGYKVLFANVGHAASEQPATLTRFGYDRMAKVIKDVGIKAE